MLKCVTSPILCAVDFQISVSSDLFNENIQHKFRERHTTSIFKLHDLDDTNSLLYTTSYQHTMQGLVRQQPQFFTIQLKQNSVYKWLCEEREFFNINSIKK